MGAILKAGPGLRAPGTADGEGRLVIAGGMVWTPAGPRRADLLVAGGKVAAIGESIAGCDDVETVDARGAQVVPGFIDVHVHVADRIGPYELADDFASASEVAIRSGVTTFYTFATQRPGEPLAATLERYRARAAGACRCDVGLHLTPTAWPWDWHEIEQLAARGMATIKLYTTYREAGLFTSWERLEEIMRRLAGLELGLLLHCEDDGVLSAIDLTGIDLADPFSHAASRPEQAEVEAIRRALELVARTGCRLHVVHVSTAAGAELISEARGRSPVTCETGPQYLLLSDDRLRGAGGHRALCTPPLRDEATRESLVRLAVEGAIDLLATDHCAFRRQDKDAWTNDYRAVPNGLPGLGALAPLAFELLVREHGREVGELVRLLAENPARLVGVYPRKGALVTGADADVAVLDADGPERPLAATLADAHDPWRGRTTRLAARHVLLRGRRVVADGELLGGVRPSGAWLSARSRART